MNYWDNRYKTGGTSGSGSIGASREWKWKIIDKYCPLLTSVIDIGCGDMSFWGDRILPIHYIGIDISSEIISRNQKIYPNAQFKVISSIEPLSYTSEIVFCFDMLFHIMDENEHRKTLENCCLYSQKYIFIYTWIINPLKKWIFFETDRDAYQRYHNPKIIDQILTTKGFDRIACEQNVSINPYGAMFIFKKNY